VVAVAEIKPDEIITKSAPSQATNALNPAKTDTPVVGPAPTNLTANPPVVLLMTTYALL
jgi:hypothetical protein